jgi:O-antigen/teichoic acid export membrane protein
VRDRIRRLSTGVAIYGAGDAAVQLVNFALLPVYVKFGFLTGVDYGALAVIAALEAFARVLSRLGLDGAFMRYFHDGGDALPRFASTLIWFLLAVDLVWLSAGLAASGWIGSHVLHDAGYVPALRLMFVNTFLIALTFVPFHAMRMQNAAVTYSGFVFARSAATLVLKGVLVIGLGFGLTGFYLADLIVTIGLLPWLWPWFRPLVGAVFSRDDLRRALRFGLPRVPHGLALQTLDGGNKLLFGSYITLGQLGVYQNGVTLGSAIKFFTSAFETAWAPFYYATALEPDAKTVFSKVTTYGIAVLTLLVAGTTAVAWDAVPLVLTPEYTEAASILPLIALGMGFQGVYLLTSIGLNLTSRTEFYPVATFAAVGVGLGGGVALMPRYGAGGAALAFLLAYLTQAALALVFARRVYPVPYERGRIARVVIAGVAAAVAARFVRAGISGLSPLPGIVLSALVTVSVYGGLLWATGFLRATERAFLRETVARFRRRAGARRGGQTDVV